MKKYIFILTLLVIFLLIIYIVYPKDKEPKNKKGTVQVNNDITLFWL